VINVEPKSTKLDESILQRMKPDPPLLLRDHFHPPRASTQSCFDLPPIPKDVTFELNPDYICMLPKFTGFEDPYLFIREFSEVCSLIHMPRVPNNIVILKNQLFPTDFPTKKAIFSI